MRDLSTRCEACGSRCEDCQCILPPWKESQGQLGEQVIDPRDLDDQSMSEGDQAVGLDGGNGGDSAVVTANRLNDERGGAANALRGATPFAFGPSDELLVAFAGMCQRVLR